ncbi:MAG: DUF2480 family protein [Bacteroidota bacterium]
MLAIFCSTDAIIPTWAYMLVTANATPVAKDVFQGTPAEYYQFIYRELLRAVDPAQYEDKRIVIKGCSDKPVPPAAYVELTKLLRPFAKSIMFGEPCSTVPVFKKPRVLKK